MVYYCIFWSGQLLLVNSPGTGFLRVLYPSSVGERKNFLLTCLPNPSSNRKLKVKFSSNYNADLNVYHGTELAGWEQTGPK